MAEKHAPDSLKYQWRLMGLVQRAPWATGLDKSVAYEIIDNYYPKYGNSRASLSYLQTATGADRKAVIASTRRLTERGPFSVLRQGVGTRPTEYKLHFDLIPEKPSGGSQTTTSEAESSSGVETTTASGSQTTTSQPSSGSQTTESVLPDAGLQTGIQDRMNKDCAPPSAPPGSPLGGATGADGHKKEKTKFDELWSAYGHRQARAAARAAYDKLAPEADLHIEMIEAATAWRAHWERQGNPDAPRKTLGSWLRSEGYLEDPPTTYKPKERKAKAAKPVPIASNDNAEKFSEWDVGAFSPFGTFTGTIVESNVIDGETGDIDVILGFDTTGSGTADIHHTIHLQNHDQRKQERGQRFFAQVSKFADMYSVEGTEELHGTEATFTIDKCGQITYHGGRPGPDAKPQPPLPESTPRPINTSAAPWRQA